MLHVHADLLIMIVLDIDWLFGAKHSYTECLFTNQLICNTIFSCKGQKIIDDTLPRFLKLKMYIIKKNSIMKHLITSLFFLVTSHFLGFSQTFNLGFEKVSNPDGLPDGWTINRHSSYTVKMDYITKSWKKANNS